MLIGIDGNEANEVRSDIGAPAGVNVYAFELLKSIYLLQDEWKAKYKVVVYLKSPPSPMMPKPTKAFGYHVIPGRGMWVLTRLTPYLFKTKDRPDVIFSPSHYTPLLAPMPRVCSIMDLGYLKFSGHLKKKDYWQLKYWTASSIKSASKVFAISQSTKDDIVRRYPESHAKVVVTHLGYDPKLYNPEVVTRSTKHIKRVLGKYSIGSEYVLYLGVLKPSKNIEGLIHAWSKIVGEFPNYALVIAGKKGWMYENIYQSVKKLGLDDKVIFTGYIQEVEKPLIVSSAKLFVLPSFWEGFGHDVLHALACGVPVAVSDVGSLPEVAGEGGVYFDPNKTEDIAAKIKKVLSMSKSDYNKLADRAARQSMKFSWEKTARETLSVLEKAAGKKDK